MTEQLCPNQGEPPPADAAAGEGAELVKWLKTWRQRTERAAELLARQTHPPVRPMPESELSAFCSGKTVEELEPRAAELLQRQQPQPVPAAAEVADEEIDQCLIDAGVDAMEGESDGTCRTYYEGWRDQVIAGIRAAIAFDRSRQHPQPVPVSERLPGPEDCDEMGRCWWYEDTEDCCGVWSLDIFDHEYTHWISAHALPLPS